MIVKMSLDGLSDMRPLRAISTLFSSNFDHWGIELGKVLAQLIFPQLASAPEPELEHDRSTDGLIRRYRKLEDSTYLKLVAGAPTR
jgi:hypothetical protein